MVKKLLGYLMCFSLTFNWAASSYILAAEALSEDVQEDTMSEVLVHEEKDVREATGNLEVDVKFVLPISNTLNTNMGLKLSNTSGSAVDISFDELIEPSLKTYYFDGKDIDVSVRRLDKEGNNLIGIDPECSIVYIGVSIYGLRQGEVNVSLYGDGYKTVNTSTTIDDYSKRITISNEKGMFEPGDVNEDGEINDTDVDLMINNFDTQNSSYDLNRDGLVNLADLNYITSSINGEERSISIVNTSAVLSENDVIVTGTNGDIFSGNETVSIAPKDENEDISLDNPVTLELEMKRDVNTSEIRIETGYENIPTKFEVKVITEDGEEIVSSTKSFEEVNDVHNFTDKASPNTIVIKLAKQIAVKRVIITITETSSNKLADIAKVDFLNNVYEEVPVPNVERPTNLNVSVGSESMVVTYDNMRNVTGYEILVEELVNGSAVKQTIYQTTYNEFHIQGLTNYTNYGVRIQSVNNEWKSGYGNQVVVTPIPTRKPPAVDMVVVSPVYAGFDVSWKDMKDTISYNLYYRELGSEEYKVIKNIDGTSYQLRDLKVGVTYEIYLTGNNDLGEGNRSSISKGVTKNSIPTITPKYKLINTDNGVGELTSHIVDVDLGSGSASNGNKFALVDNDDLTYFMINDWDDGASYNVSTAPTIILDDRYTMDTFIVTVPDNYNHSFYKSAVYYYNEEETIVKVNASVCSRKDKNNRTYFIVKTSEPITTNKVRIAFSVYGSYRNLQMSEVKLYQYDSLANDTANLFLDDLRVELRSGVTLEDIEELEKRANEEDPVSGEYIMDKDVILSDLEYAKKILNDEDIQDVITLDTKISTANDTHLGFAMNISDLQPLGVIARSGETITLYVGSDTKELPELVFTQYYAEANSWRVTYNKLTKGQNIISVPKIGSDEAERGGSLYLRFPNKISNSTIKVRVSGGEKIPVLDLHDIEDEGTKKTLISKYIDELSSYVNILPSLYKNSETEYNERTSVLNSTEIVTDKGLFSIPATSALKAINSSLTTKDERVERVINSTYAFDEMMGMFYRHKGLEDVSEDIVNRAPTSRINIRYMRMFDGAFMYAGGSHIGVGYDSTGGLLVGKPYDKDQFGGYFGWGISHEIGHQINQGNLAYAEVTNNIYSLLAQTANDINTSRLESSNIYPKIYEKVTSGTKGKSSNVFVSLGMYWQLHLAYDDNLTFSDKTSVFSKINKLSRTSTDNVSKDDLLVKYACMATNENLLEFFTNWGYDISDETKEYVNSNYPVKSKAIWYLNDEARRYRINGGKPISESTVVNARYADVDSQNKRIVLNFGVNSESDKILGYEIKRNGKVIAFVDGNTYTDIVGAVNNRAVKYEVSAYDYLLNKTNTIVLDEIKVSFDGSINTSNFSILSNFMGENDNLDYEDPDMDFSKLSVNNLIDNDESTLFNGNVRINSKSGDDAYVIIDLNNKLAVSGLKYKAINNNGVIDTNTINKYEIYVSSDRENWTLAKTGEFNLSNENDHILVYFDKEGTTGEQQIWTYNDVSYVKIVSVGNKYGISGAQIDLISPPNDNIDLDVNNIGVLDRDYCYQVNETDENGNFTGELTEACIKRGNIVIKGEYTGNPAFNVGVLVDALDSSIKYSGEQLFFAELNNEGNVYEIANGTWIYAVTKDEYEKMASSKVRAILYRVDDALSLEGERVTSTSLGVTLPKYEELKSIVIDN